MTAVERPLLDVSLVQRHLIDAIWPKVAPLLKRGSDASEGRHDFSGLKEKLLNDPVWHLWCIFEPDLTIVAAFTTTFANYPRGKALQIELMGGKGLDEWQDLFANTVDGWARDNGCMMIEFIGRRGWVKLARNGYRPVHTVYQRDLQ